MSIGVSLIGDRWSLLIVRELMAGASRFSEIAWGLPGLSRPLLSSRLRHLERIGVLHRSPAPTGGNRKSYYLTEAGHSLRPIIDAIGLWTLQWHFPPPTPEETHTPLLLWRIAQGISRPRLGRERVCLEFRFPGVEPSRGWVRVEGTRSAVCLQFPGDDPDLVITAAPEAVAEVWYGHQSLSSAVRDGSIRLVGSDDLRSSFSHWFARSPFAETSLMLHAASPASSSVQELN